MRTSERKEKKEIRKQRIKKEIEKLKTLKAKYQRQLTVSRLKAIRGFENLSDEMAEQLIESLEEYAKIVLRQINRLSKETMITNPIKH